MTTTTRTAASNRQAVVKATQDARRSLKVLGGRWTAPVGWVAQQIGYVDPGSNPSSLIRAAADLRAIAAALRVAADDIDARATKKG